MIKRSLAVAGVASAMIAMVFAGTPAMAQPELPVPGGPEVKTTTRCVEGHEAVKKVVSYVAKDPFTWVVTVGGKLPLCDKYIAVGATWRYDKLGEMWPQTLVGTGESIEIKQPGQYTVAAPPRKVCGQTDGYVEKGVKPNVPGTLDKLGDPDEPHLLWHYFSGPKPWSFDDAKKCKPAKPEVSAEVKACVAEGDKDGEVTVTITNPNHYKVTYGVKLGGLEPKKLEIAGNASGEVVFSGLAAGEYKLTVSDKHNGTTTTVVVEECSPPTTTTTVPTTTTDTTVPTTSTTTPGIVPVGNNTPGGEELAETGASIGWPLGIAALLLIAGGVLLFIYRRRGRLQNN